MPKPKPKRKALIIKLWNQGKSNQEILTALGRAGYKGIDDAHSLSDTISRLKRRGKLPKERPQLELAKVEREGIDQAGKAFGGAVKIQVGRVNKTPSKRRDKSTSQQVYKRVTYYLAPEMIKKIKLLAVQRDIDISELVREILTGYLSKQ